jgi:hypothetical protein
MRLRWPVLLVSFAVCAALTALAAWILDPLADHRPRLRRGRVPRRPVDASALGVDPRSPPPLSASRFRRRVRPNEEAEQAVVKALQIAQI